MKITFYSSLTPLPNCQHKQRQPTKFMPVTFKLINMAYDTVYDGKFVGRRLWWYTKAGGRFVELIIKLREGRKDYGI